MGSTGLPLPPCFSNPHALSPVLSAGVCAVSCVSQPLQSVPSPRAHCAGCLVPAGRKASGLPLEGDSVREEKIVSGTSPCSEAGGGLRAIGGGLRATGRGLRAIGGGLKALTLLQQKIRCHVDIITCA